MSRGNGHDLASRNTTFAEFYINWVDQVKKNDVKESTYNNYRVASNLVRQMFGDTKMKNMNDILVQIKIDEYADEEFNVLLLLELDTGIRRSEILALHPENLFEYGIEVHHSLDPVTHDDSLNTTDSRRDISITQEVYRLVKKIEPKSTGYIFDDFGYISSC